MVPDRDYLPRIREAYPPPRVAAIEAVLEDACNSVGTETRICQVDYTIRQAPLLLTVSSADEPSVVYTLRIGEYYIGRFCNNHIQLKQDWVSRAHARLMVHADGHITLRDLWSRNGTRVNGYFITPGKRHSIDVGDTILITNVKLTLSQP